MNNKYNTITPEQATNRGYKPVTDPYTEDEYDMLDRALFDLRNTDHVLVRTLSGIAICRKVGELDPFKRNEKTGVVS